MKQRSAALESLENFLRTMGDLMVLNWLWFLCSLPVVTVGPATCALYSVTLKLAHGEPVSTVKDFFLGFRNNLKEGFLLSIAALVLAVVAAGDAWFALQQAGSYRTLYLVVAAVIGVIFLIFLCYTFALQAKFENPLKTQVKNAFLLAFISPGRTIAMWLILIFPLAFALLIPQIAVQMLGFVYLMLAFSGPAYLNSQLLCKIFEKVGAIPSGEEV